MDAGLRQESLSEQDLHSGSCWAQSLGLHKAGLSREIANRRDVCKQMCYKELACVIMEADKFQDLQSATWRVREPVCSSSQKTGRLKTQEEPLFWFELEAEKDQYPIQQASRSSFPLTHGS